VIVACATMFLRILVLAGIAQTALALALLWPMVVMGVACYVAAGYFWWRSGNAPSSETRVSNPFEIRTALLFAGLIAALMVLSRALADAFGDAGVYLLAAASGIADVDAITLSLAGMAGDSLAMRSAALAILVAAFVNTAVKGGLAFGIGGRALGLRVGTALAIVVAAGLATWRLAG
jgi:uncharacterized membrane protein (DUF4010 family)